MANNLILAISVGSNWTVNLKKTALLNLYFEFIVLTETTRVNHFVLNSSFILL